MKSQDLLELFNELGKEINARLAEHFISFSQRVSRFNNTGEECH